MGFADEILNEAVHSKKQSAVPKFSEEILGETVQRHFKKTDETSAITGEPIEKFTGEGGEGADLITHFKQGFVDDPLTKVRIYAADRFPELSEEERMKRYKYQDGEVIFQADSGKWYSESPELPTQRLKRFAGETAAHSPAIAGATFGELTGGPVSAAILGAGGEAVRKAVGRWGFGEDATAIEYLKSVGTEGALSAVGSVPGRAVNKAARKAGSLLGGLKGHRTMRMAGKDYPSIDFKEAAKIQIDTKKKFGVDLFDAQTTESRRLLDKINMYGDLPETADLVQAAKRIQDEQAFRAVDEFWDGVSKGSRPASEVGEELSEAARKSIKREVDKMVANAKPHYDEAFSSSAQINIVPDLTTLDKKIANSLENGPRRKKLEQFRRMLLRTEIINGNEVLVPESRIRQLDELKKSVDVFLKPKVGDEAVDNETKTMIRDIKNSILDRIDVANLDYQKARQIWAGDKSALDKLTNKTRLKSLADLKGNQNFVPAVDQLFSNVRNDEKMMGEIRDRIIRESPEMWDEIVRTRIEGVFNSIKQSAEGGSANSAKLFNSFYRNTVGDAKQNKLIAAAMGGEDSAKYKHFRDFADMLRRVGSISRKESTTAIRQESLKEEKKLGLAAMAFKVKAYPLVTWQKALFDRAKDFNTVRGRKLMAEALLDTRAHGQIIKIRKLGLGTEAGVRAASTFLSLVLGGEYRRHGTSLIDYETGESQ